MLQYIDIIIHIIIINDFYYFQNITWEYFTMLQTLFP